MTRPESYIQYSDKDRERLHGESQDPDDERSDFERDRSRILHSAAFRRQGGKTQAFPTGQSDFFRNRLTHALEVAQIAKGLALRLGADTDLCEAAALAHDIGHPPFGHSGEDVLESLMASHGGFEANAQNYRVVCLLEKKAPEHEGLDLSRATLDALFKYKSPIAPTNKKGYYVDDEVLLETFKWIGGPTDEQSFECQLMDYADDIAYAVHDLEDGLHAQLITQRSAYKHQDDILQLAQKYNPDCDDDDVVAAISEVGDIEVQWEPADVSERQMKGIRKDATSVLIGTFIKAAAYEDRSGDWDVERYRRRLVVPLETLKLIAALKALNFRLLVINERVTTMDARARRILEDLFEAFTAKGAASLYPEDFRPAFDSGGKEGRPRVACDYISGMTDSYASRMHQRLFSGGRVALFD